METVLENNCEIAKGLIMFRVFGSVYMVVVLLAFLARPYGQRRKSVAARRIPVDPTFNIKCNLFNFQIFCINFGGSNT